MFLVYFKSYICILITKEPSTTVSFRKYMRLRWKKSTFFATNLLKKKRESKKSALN